MGKKSRNNGKLNQNLYSKNNLPFKLKVVINQNYNKSFKVDYNVSFV